MVTLMVTVWPGLMTIGEKVAAGLMAASQTSLVSDVTAGSNALVIAVMAMFAVPAGAGPLYGPHSLGTALQTPAVAMPPPGAYEPDGVVVQSGPAPGLLLAMSG